MSVMAWQRVFLWVTVPFLAFSLVVGCGDDGTPSDDDDGSGGTTSTGGSDAGGSDAGGSDAGGAGGMAPFVVTSTAFGEGETIPMVHECGPPAPVPNGTGDNETPPLAWTAGPAGTQSYAVVVRDVDATVAQFPNGIIHWVIYDIPASVLSLPQAVPDGYEVADPAGAKQGEVQGSSYFGYFGPCSPNSINTYVFTVYAMGEANLPVMMSDSERDIALYVEANAIASTSLSGES